MTQNLTQRIKRTKCLSLRACLGVALALGVAGLLCGCPVPPGPETGCVDSGGTLGTALCCGAVSDFPDTCAVGACGCAAADSHEVMVCECGEGDCFDGTQCVPQP